MPLFQRKLGRMLAALDKAMSTFRGHSRKACALRCRIFYSLAKLPAVLGLVLLAVPYAVMAQDVKKLPVSAGAEASGGMALHRPRPNISGLLRKSVWNPCFRRKVFPHY